MQSLTTNTHGHPVGTGRLRVLIVDDEATCAASLAEVIEELGAETQVCLRGEDALAVTHAFNPEMVLLDLEMPGLSGFDIAAAIRTFAQFSATKLIAISGHNDPEAKRGTAKAGFDLHLAKPVRLNVLEDIVELTRALSSSKGPQSATA